MLKKSKSIAAIIMIAFLFSACNLPMRNTPVETPTPSQAPNPAYTAAAQTIVAQLTQVSNPASPTPPPGAAETAGLTAGSGAEGTATASAETEPVATEAVSAGTPTSEATATEIAVTEAIPTIEATVTASSQPTATLDPDDPKSGLGEPAWLDPFDDGSQWALYVDRNAAFEVKDGDLVMTSYTIGSRNAWMLTQPQPLNYYLEITARPQSCSGRDRYGVIVRSDAVVGYIFAFSCDGRYSFRKWNGQRATVLVDWTSSTAIQDGSDQTNRLGIRVSGSQFSLYANGTLLTEVSDPSYPDGGFGVLVGAENTEDFEVRVSEAAYWELP